MSGVQEEACAVELLIASLLVRELHGDAPSFQDEGVELDDGILPCRGLACSARTVFEMGEDKCGCEIVNVTKGDKYVICDGEDWEVLKWLDDNNVHRLQIVSMSGIEGRTKLLLWRRIDV